MGESGAINCGPGANRTRRELWPSQSSIFGRTVHTLRIRVGYPCSVARLKWREIAMNFSTKSLAILMKYSVCRQNAPSRPAPAPFFLITHPGNPFIRIRHGLGVRICICVSVYALVSNCVCVC